MITLQELLAKNARIRAEREEKLKKEEENKKIEEEKEVVEKSIDSKKGKKKKIVTESVQEEIVEKPETRNYMVVEDIENVNDEDSTSVEKESLDF